jgi:hypothetical protein
MRIMTLARNVTYIGGNRNTYRILVRKHEEATMGDFCIDERIKWNEN